ncbi:MAG: cupredoxin domain-containing protein, partial [Candidatus Poribacteria bacterium]|nr:cupredoxin domain-containing protein [Candidatus Poribacteria bacterium]
MKVLGVKAMMRRIPTLAFLMIALAATALSGCDQPDRTIVIVADDMEFRGGNPLLKANPGERVRLIFKNEAKGIIHEISIPQLKVKSERLMPGEEQVLNFIVPKDGGEFEY